MASVVVRSIVFEVGQMISNCIDSGLLSPLMNAVGVLRLTLINFMKSTTHCPSALGFRLEYPQ